MTIGYPMIPSEAQRGALPPGGPWASPSSRNSAKNPAQAGGGSGRTGWANSRAQGQAGLAFFGRGDRVLSQAHTHAHTHHTLPQPPHQSTAAPGGHSAIKHTQGSHVLSRTQVSHAHRCAHTQGKNRRLWGPRQGGFSAVVAQEHGEDGPLLGERPCEEDG